MKINKNEKIAEIVGLSFGDGSLTKRKTRNKLRFQLRGDIIEDRDHYDNYIIPLFNTNITLPLINKKISVIESNKKKKSYGIAIESNKIGNFLSECGIIPVGRKLELSIPKWIKNKKKNATCFIRGFFDTDGTIFCQKNYSLKKVKKHTQIRLKLSTTSKKLANDLKERLDILGLKTFFKTDIKKKTNEKTAYHVEIDGGINIDRWFKIIGSKNPKHITKYIVWKKFGFCPPYTTLSQRKAILAGELNPSFFYNSDNLPLKNAGMSELGQKNTVEDKNQKPYGLVPARVQIPFPADFLQKNLVKKRTRATFRFAKVVRTDTKDGVFNRFKEIGKNRTGATFTP